MCLIPGSSAITGTLGPLGQRAGSQAHPKTSRLRPLPLPHISQVGFSPDGSNGDTLMKGWHLRGGCRDQMRNLGV
jgi:hypothetical protein